MKHIFRRFGGTFEGSDGGSIGAAIIGAVGLVVFCATTLVTGNPAYVLAGFTWLFLFTVFSLFGKSGATSDLKQQLHKEYLANAIKLYHDGDFQSSHQYFIRAEMYGVIPLKYAKLHREVVEKSLGTPLP